MKSFTALVIYLGLGCVAYADQPQSKKVIEAFLQQAEVASKVNQLKADGWTIGDSSATMAAAAWNDEGTEGIYLVSVYYEKGSQPWNKQNGVLTGVADFAMGHIEKIKLVDASKAAAALLSIR